ncbi:zinc finger protein 574 [Platysternon megacephalum]|uniref:Zinc finger protein 574 n=1 Tax=Platysternon megacephalum TaxID=55544 RepID=A0A4D9DL82_9SAUR|nr:zinc finger protein 574 [Platysternon megacephalum]
MSSERLSSQPAASWSGTETRILVDLWCKLSNTHNLGKDGVKICCSRRMSPRFWQRRDFSRGNRNAGRKSNPSKPHKIKDHIPQPDNSLGMSPFYQDLDQALGTAPSREPPFP